MHGLSLIHISEYFETIWEQEDSGYFHDNKKLANRKSVKNAVLELQNGYQKYFEENKERICDTDYTCLLYTSGFAENLITKYNSY